MIFLDSFILFILFIYFLLYTIFASIPSFIYIIALLNQESSVLYGGPTPNYGAQLSLYLPYMLRVNRTRDLAHMQLSDLQEEIAPTSRTSDLQGERILIRRT